MNASERRAGYLDDLGRLLQEMTPVERIGVVDRVRERIDKAVARLGHDPSDAEMAGILAGIGDVEDVAAEALAARTDAGAAGAAEAPSAPSAPVSAPAPASTSAPASTPTSHDSAPPASATSAASSTSPSPSSPSSTSSTSSTPATAAPAGGPRYDLSSIPAMEWPEDAAPRPGLTKRWVMVVVLPLIGLGAFFALFLLPVLALIVGVAVLWMSPLWTRQERVVGTVVPAVGLGAFLPLLAIGSGADGSPMMLLLALLLAVAGVGTLVWLAIRGSRAARRVDEEMAAAAAQTASRR